jgi:putative transcription antitermination factor YqgF
VLGEVDTLRALAGGEVTVETHDERLTTVIAERGMRAAGARRAARRRNVDASAAAVMLQSYLEART